MQKKKGISNNIKDLQQWQRKVKVTAFKSSLNALNTKQAVCRVHRGTSPQKTVKTQPKGLS